MFFKKKKFGRLRREKNTVLKKRKTRYFFNKFLGGLKGLNFLKSFIKISWIYWLVFGSMSVFLVFAIFSPYFGIKKITVERNSLFIDANEVENSLVDFFGKNLLFIREDDISHLLKQQFPEISEFKIKSKFPNELQLEINVSPPIYNILNDFSANFSLISKNGIILKFNSAIESLPVIKIFQYDKIINPRNKFLPLESLEKIELAQNILENQLGFPVKNIHILYYANEVHFLRGDGTKLWLDLSLEIEPQLQKLDLSSEKIGLYKKILNILICGLQIKFFGNTCDLKTN